MCQLLGVSSNRSVNIDFSFREWQHRGKENPDGYGFAFWRNKSLQLIKAASNLYEAGKNQKGEIRRIRSHMFVCHVRLASVGPKDGKNTHPFISKMADRSFAFAHNGTIPTVKNWPLINGRPEGETDSEHAFLWLLDQLWNIPKKDFSKKLKVEAEKIRENGHFNFLLSDGSTMWAYADNSLYYIERTPPYNGELIRLKDNGYSISLEDVKTPNEQAVIVATCPLSDESGWTKMRVGELLVIHDGSVVKDTN